MTPEASRPSIARRLLRWARNLLIGLVGIFLIALGVVYAVSESILRRTYSVTAESVPVPSDAASIAEGKRLASLRGCDGCHGPALEGRIMVDEALMGRISAPNLARSAARHTDAELVAMIRHGVRPDGRSIVIMPAATFSVLDDRDVGMILAYMRSLPESEGPDRLARIGPIARVGLALGELEPAAATIEHAAQASAAYPAAGEPHARGAYLARSVCTSCHGLTLEGREEAPALAIALAYSLPDFTRLMRTGKGLGDRELETMGEAARFAFKHFTDDEIAALHAFLVARAAPGSAK